MIEEAKVIDYFDIQLLGEKSLPIYYKLNELLDLRTFGYKIYKYTVNNSIIGFVIFYINDKLKNIHIYSIAVDENVRNKGVGSQLIKSIKNKYDYSLTLNVSINNTNALKFYEKNNFIIIEEKENYYENLDIKNAYFMKYFNKI